MKKAQPQKVSVSVRNSSNTQAPVKASNYTMSIKRGGWSKARCK